MSGAATAIATEIVTGRRSARGGDAVGTTRGSGTAIGVVRGTGTGAVRTLRPLAVAAMGDGARRAERLPRGIGRTNPSRPSPGARANCHVMPARARRFSLLCSPSLLAISEPPSSAAATTLPFLNTTHHHPLRTTHHTPPSLLSAAASISMRSETCPGRTPIPPLPSRCPWRWWWRASPNLNGPAAAPHVPEAPVPPSTPMQSARIRALAQRRRCRRCRRSRWLGHLSRTRLRPPTAAWRRRMCRASTLYSATFTSPASPAKDVAALVATVRQRRRRWCSTHRRRQLTLARFSSPPHRLLHPCMSAWSAPAAAVAIEA